jgi:hypothetical protein
LDTTPGDGKMILSYEALTSAEVSSPPSWKRTPRRRMNVYVRPSLAAVHDAARSPTIRLPVRSAGSTRRRVL